MAPDPAWLAETSATLARETALIGDGVRLVASGAAPRVTLANLRFADELIDTARAMAAANGLRLRPIYEPGDHGADLVIEQADEVEPS